MLFCWLIFVNNNDFKRIKIFIYKTRFVTIGVNLKQKGVDVGV